MWRRSLDGHRQAELTGEQPAVTQQWQPRVSDNRLKCRAELQPPLTTHVVYCEQHVVTVSQLGRQADLYLVTETWTPAQQMVTGQDANTPSHPRKKSTSQWVKSRPVKSPKMTANSLTTKSHCRILNCGSLIRLANWLSLSASWLHCWQLEH